MTKLASSIAALMAALSVVAPPLSATGAEIRAFMTIAVRGAVETLIPGFEKASGDRVVPTWATAAMLNERIRNGEAADLLISTRAGIDALAQGAKIVAGSDADIARIGIGVAVRQGEPKPDISTSEALKRTLLAARAVSYSDPAAGGVSGVHFGRLLERLGIANEMKGKSKFPPPAGLSADLLVTGEADLAVQQVSELLTVKGIELVGPLPGDLQLVTTFTAGVPVNARQAEAAKAFVRFLQSAEAAATLKARVLDSPTKRAPR